MGYPTLVGVSHGVIEHPTGIALPSPYALTLPAGAVGDLLLVVLTHWSNAPGALMSWPAGWTDLARLQIEPGTSPDGRMDAFYRVADGTEGASISVGVSPIGVVAYRSFRFAGVVGVPAVSTSVNTTQVGSQSPLTPPLTPGFGHVYTSWLVLLGEVNGSRTVNGYPGGYTDQTLDRGQAGVALATARKETTEEAEIPGTFSLTGTAWYAVMTVALNGGPVSSGPPYVPPGPSLALLEIWTSDPGAPRWDEAVWDGASWGMAGWRNVTPLGVEVRIQWGSTRPELGILSVPDAGSWYVTFHDPDRLLDPANPDSPYAGDLRPGLPIRVTHRGIAIRTGVSDVIGHSLADRQTVIRGSDAISLMARADVPPDVSLPDTLRARAVAAIAAAGITVRVDSPPSTGDPALAPQPDGPMTVWEIVRDAAQSVLHIPYVDENGILRFRLWRYPQNRQRVIGSPNLVDLQSIVDTAGLLDTVQVQQTAGEGGLLIERQNTPTPYFGHRVFKRSNETPDADGFATAILNDRAVTGIRWVPGDLYAATAADVEYFARLQAVERVTLRVTETEPNIAVPVIIVGGTVTVRGRTDRSADWTFSFEAASTNEDAVLLTLDGGSDTDYLTTESGSDYLYGDV